MLSRTVTFCIVSHLIQCFNLEAAVGSQKSTQALGAPRTIKKCLITHKVTTNFFISLCTSIPYTSFLRPTAVSRFICLRRVSFRVRQEITGNNWPRRFWSEPRSEERWTIERKGSEDLAKSGATVVDQSNLGQPPRNRGPAESPS